MYMRRERWTQEREKPGVSKDMVAFVAPHPACHTRYPSGRVRTNLHTTYVSTYFW